MIPEIGDVNTQNPVIPNVGIGDVRNRQVRQVRTREISDNRVWVTTTPQAIPIEVPVTTQVGIPIVNMPGCVKMSKENNYPSPGNRNMNLVNDDPKGNTVLCDAGMPYFEPPDYQANELTWTTVDMEPDEVEEGVKTEPPAPNTQTPEPPKTPPQTSEDVPCPPPNARRIGDLNQAGTERVKEYKLIKEGTICETIWEPIPFVDKYLPSVNVVTTTAGIAVVATGSALLAKPLADLLLKVVKPVVKKAIGKVKALLGKKEPVLSTRQRILAQREQNRAILELRKAVGKPPR